VEIVAVPGCHALGAVVRIIFRHINPAGDGIGLADTVGTTTLRHGFAHRDHPRTGGNAVFGVDLAGEFALGGAVGENETRGHRERASRYPRHLI
jgi:hypothetical protein